MRIGQRLNSLLAWIAVAGLTVPSSAAANPPPGRGIDNGAPAHDRVESVGFSALEMPDVALSGTGLLSGQVYDVAGRPVASQEIALLQRNHLVALSQTDRDGRFQIARVRGGTYQIATAGQIFCMRAWVGETAPPAATPELLIVLGDYVLRGQYCGGCGQAVGCGDTVGCGCGPDCGQGYRGGAYGGRPFVRWMRANPAVVVAGIAAAIAIPVAVTAADDDDHS